MAGIDYKARAEFWKAQSGRNLDMLADALAEVRELQCELHALKLIYGDPGANPEEFWGCSIVDLLKPEGATDELEIRAADR